MAATATTAAQFKIQVGSPDDVVPAIAAEEAVAPVRGLTIRRLTLNENFDGRIAAWLNRGVNEIYFIASSIMFGEEEAFVFPETEDGAAQAVLKLKVGETHEFSLGAGAPLFPERELKSGVAVAIWVWESDNDRVKAGKKIKAVADSVKSDGNIAAILASAIKNPGAFTAKQVLGAIGEVAKVVGTILEQDQDEQVAVFLAYFPMRSSWDGMLKASQAGASIELAEISE